MSAFLAGISADQKLQQVCEAMDKLWNEGTWAGLLHEVSLTSTAGVITLAAADRRLDGLMDTSNDNCGCRVRIKSQSWPYQPGGPGRPSNWNQWCGYVALDLGDNSSGLRQYELTGNTTTNDAKTFKGLARKRFNYITNTADVVVPDCYDALYLAVKAIGQRYQDDTSWQASFAEAVRTADQNLGNYFSQEEWGSIQIAPEQSIGASVQNLV